MGRAKSNQGWRHWRKQKKQGVRELEEFLMTPEEVEQSAKVSSQKRRLEMAALPEPKAMPQLADPKAYGDWRLPPGHENWVQDRIKAIKETPFPEVFSPPLPRVQMEQVKDPPMFGPPPASGEVFKGVYPELAEQAKAFLEPPPPPECEGAVGYDQEYYATPYLIRRVGRRKPPSVAYRGPSIMDARRCAQMIADDRKRQAAKARKMPKAKAKAKKKVLNKPMWSWRCKKWLRLNKNKKKPQKTKVEPQPEQDKEMEVVLNEFEDMCLEEASGYSSDASTTSLMEFLALEKSME